MASEFIDTAGILNVISGAALLVYWYSYALFMPYRRLSTTLSLLVKNRYWTPINALGVIGALAGMLGQTGILVAQMEKVGLLGMIGFLVASVGTTLLIGPMLWETILWPILVSHDETLLDFQGPIYRSKTFVPYFILSGLVYSAGYVMVGIEIMRAGILPAAGGLLLAVGAPTFGLGALFGNLQVYVRSVGVTLLSIGLVVLGIAMIH